MGYVVTFLIGLVIGFLISFIAFADLIKRVNEDKKKIGEYYHLFSEWLSNYRNGKYIEDYLKRNGYKRIAIYGMKEIGLHLWQELQGSDIEVVCAIDKNLSVIPPELKGYKPAEQLPEVDVIIIAASYYFDEIKKALLHNECDIISIDDIVYYK